MLLPERFKEILSTKGRDLTEIGLHDVALSKQDAIEAIRSLLGHEIAVLGGDFIMSKKAEFDQDFTTGSVKSNPTSTRSNSPREVRSWH
jgi:hypothetical protein